MEKFAYDPDLDERNTADSVFCKAGSGYVVPWYEADALMHVEPTGVKRVAAEDAPTVEGEDAPKKKKSSAYLDAVATDKELERIFEMTYGKIKPRRASERTVNEAARAEAKDKPKRPKKPSDEYLIIDGYNLIFAWDALRRKAELDLSLARDELIRIACNYSAMRKCRVIVVFDAYKRTGADRDLTELGRVSVIYTKESQTADAYIEKATYDMAKDHFVRVVTSDMQEQFVILGNGAFRVSPKEFISEVSAVSSDISELSEKR